jgi:hypothetical protein
MARSQSSPVPGRGLGRAYSRQLAGSGVKIAGTDLNLKSYAEFEAEAEDMTAVTGQGASLLHDFRVGGPWQPLG